MNKTELRRDAKRLLYDVNDQIMVWVEQVDHGLIYEKRGWAVFAQLTTKAPGLATTMATSEAFGLFQALDLAWLVVLTVRNTLDHAGFEEVCREVHNMLPQNELMEKKFSRLAELPILQSTKEKP